MRVIAGEKSVSSDSTGDKISRGTSSYATPQDDNKRQAKKSPQRHPNAQSTVKEKQSSREEMLEQLRLAKEQARHANAQVAYLEEKLREE